MPAIGIRIKPGCTVVVITDDEGRKFKCTILEELTDTQRNELRKATKRGISYLDAVWLFENWLTQNGFQSPNGRYDDEVARRASRLHRRAA